MANTLLLAASNLFLAQATAQNASAASAYTVKAGFPTSIYTSFYVLPAATQEPQPAIHDPITGELYPLNLTSATSIPTFDKDPQPLPPAIGAIPPDSQESFYQGAVKQISEIVENGQFSSSNCSICVASLNVLKALALVAPSKTPQAMVTLCNKYKLHDPVTCDEDFRIDTLGSVWTQVLQNADVSGLDGRYICYSISSSTCSRPPAYPRINATSYFPKPKPANATVPKPSGKRAKVLHMSDFHLDPRYQYGSEANCTSGLCCRTNVNNTKVAPGAISQPAALYGSFLCDTPYFLSTAALEAIHPLTGTTNGSGDLAFTLYTGDLASHDPASQLSRQYQAYTDTAVFDLFHKYLQGPVFATLGNHDTVPVAADAPESILPGQFSWNYNHVSALWLKEGWLSPDAAYQARTHYGGYSIKTPLGLRVISLNTDFWYRANLYTFVNASNPDVSGMQRWLIDELQSAEDCGEQVWIIGHVLTGWDGSNPQPNPTELFYQIVERYSPHVIRNVFWGHQHEDFSFVYYQNNGTARNNGSAGLASALMTGWAGPSITPLTNLNSGFRMYEIDTGNFEVMDAFTYYSNVSDYQALDVSKSGPVFRYEYSTRDAYSAATKWPANAPLNATFWHSVSQVIEAEAMAAGNRTGASLFPITQKLNSYQGRLSVRSPVCSTAACAYAKACYIRSGSSALGRTCPQGYASVQSAFSPST